MIDQIRSNESLQILAFVVLPLLLLLIGAIFLWVRYEPLSDATFPTFSVNFSRVGREDAYIVYRDSERRLEFYVGAGDRKQVLWLALPNDMTDEVFKKVVGNLGRGLAKLGFKKCNIVRKGQTETIASSS
jgi:hypothetical protein